MNRIQSIIICGFMRFRQVVATFPMRGLYFLRGDNRDVAFRDSNGAGKSAFIEAITWCLFGKTLRGISGDEVIRFGESTANVEMYLKIGEAWWHVNRIRRVGKTSLVLLINERGEWRDATERSIDATQERIEKGLGMDFRTFCSAVVFGQESAFKFSSLSNKERMAVLDDALGAGTYVRASELARTMRREAEAALEDARLAYGRSSDRVGEAVRKLRAAKAAAITKEEARELQLLKEERAQVSVLASKRAERLRAAKRASAEHHDAVRRHAAARLRRSSVIRERDDLERQIKEAKETGRCPLCFAPAKSTHVISELEGRLAAMAIETFDDAVNEWTIEANRLAKILKDWERAVDEAEAAAARLAEIDAALAKLDRSGGEVEMWRRALREAKEDRRTKAGLLHDAGRRRDTFAFLEQAFAPDLASAVVEAAVPALNEAAAQVSESLTDGTTVATFATTGTTKGGKVKDKLDFVVKSKVGAESYVASSEGEKAASDFIAGAAIQKVVAGGAECSVAFYDEVFDHMDAAAGERVLAWLREESKKKAVFVVSHAEWIKDEHFDATWRIVREGGVSKLEVE